ncbi:hypothetical protein XENOCAPTIV_013488 [Xenoophorus captivus]|uniref:Uncharacterized protein n=1 Tax=Xenoophorus captivus TaxID=1517983 RepID=A0ABV0Q9R5_9TELE
MRSDMLAPILTACGLQLRKLWIRWIILEEIFNCVECRTQIYKKLLQSYQVFPNVKGMHGGDNSPYFAWPYKQTDFCPTVDRQLARVFVTFAQYWLVQHVCSDSALKGIISSERDDY